MTKAEPFRGFTVLPAREFLSEGRRNLDSAGVYAIFLRGGHHILTQSGYDDKRDGVPATISGHTHMYTGESGGTRSRVAAHLNGSILDSNMRETLWALHMAYGAIDGAPDVGANLAVAEAWMTEWLDARVLVAFKLGGFVLDEEQRILRATASPLNIKGRDSRPYSRILGAARQEFRSRSEIVSARQALADRSGVRGRSILVAADPPAPRVSVVVQHSAPPGQTRQA